MKTILTASLLLAATLLATPSASADCYDDPTGNIDDLCAGHDKVSYGDCSGGADGYDFSSTYAYIYDDPGLYARAEFYENCARGSNPAYGAEYTGLVASVVVWDNGAFAAIGHHEQTGSANGCRNYAYAGAAGETQYQAIPC